MKQLFLLIALCLSLFTSYAQFDSSTFEVILSDLETNSYEKDTISKALVIYEHGYSYIDKNSYKLITKVKRKVKLFDKSAHGQINIELPIRLSDNGKETKIKDLEATTHNLENGLIKTTKLKKSDTYKEEANAYRHYLKFGFPNVQNGSVLTYSYTIESPFIYNYHPWYFQEDIPKLHSEYKTSIPGIYEYHIKLVSFKDLDIENTVVKRKCLQTAGAYANCIESVYIMKDMPAIKEEDHITTLSNYVSRVEYELKTINRFNGTVDKVTKTWKDTDKELKLEDLGKEILKKSNGKHVLPESISNIADPLARSKAIYKYVQTHFTWNKALGLYGDLSVKKLLKTKSGNAPEINILLHNLLETHGINSKAVLLSTRKNGLPTKLYPQMSNFNYLIVEATIDGTAYLLDATSKYTPFNQLPFRCLNQFGRKLDFKDGSTWIDIVAQLPSTVQERYNLKLDAEEGLLTGTILKKRSGYHATARKKLYFSNTSNYENTLSDAHEQLNISELEVSCEGPNAHEFTESYTIEFEDLNEVNGKIYLDPFLSKFFEENPFKLQERSYPVDFGYKDSFATSMQIDIGDAYEIESLPDPINLRLPDNGGSFIMQTKVIDNKLNIFLKIHFKEASYSPSMYANLKTFMNAIVNAQTKTIIVLNKKS